MARRRGFKTQAPKEATLGISVLLWLLGLLNGFGVVHLPSNLGFWSLVVAGLLLILGSLFDGI
ncbi:MAG TPA: hypothetical protein VJ725_23775 [Thermoanaerobaculia bacterium]|nr:hypothetical protein [Thermoanaerobaculia bacterium]